MSDNDHFLQNLSFVTSNLNKVAEARRILEKYDVRFKHLNLKYPEIQSPSLQEIADTSANYLYKRLRRPIFIEDSGLFINALGGFPGPYSSYALKTIGNFGILKLMKGIQKRESRFESVVAYVASSNHIYLFSGMKKGNISIKVRGKEWGFDPIFIPINSNQTYSEMGIEAKQKLSHRKVALVKFAKWFQKRK